MSNEKIQEIIKNAVLIVKGYAFFKREDGFIRILSLWDEQSSMVVDSEGQLIETNMDDIQQTVVKDLCRKNLQFMDV